MIKTFDNLAQRGVQYFLTAMADFRPVASPSATAKDQEAAYHFIKGIYEKLYADPGLLGLKTLPDDCFPEWWTPKKEKPGLPENIRGPIKGVNLLMEALYHVVQLGKQEGDTFALAKETYEIKPALAKRMPNFDIGLAKDGESCTFTFPKGVAQGLKLLAQISTLHAERADPVIHNRPMAAYTLFSHGVFDPQAPYTAEVFRRIIQNDAAFDKLTGYFAQHGFARLDHKEYKTGIKGDAFSLDYVKFYGKPEGLIGSAWKTRNFSGVEFMANELTQSGMTVGLHIPFLGEVLGKADQMSDSLREFVGCFNKCSGCRYCVQLDKTKTKPLRLVKVGNSNLCTVFAFGFTFNNLGEDMWLANGIIELMAFIDEVLADR